MKILHYSLGFPPYRSGGLTKYSIDIIKEQQKKGHHVILLWPGKFSNIKKNIDIVEKQKLYDILNYEIINPLPIPLLNGIKCDEEYTKECDINIYIKFLKKIEVDIIHIHTLMGLHKEFFEAAKQLNIKVVYTTHDYFGICPKANLLRREGICNNINENEECIKCNQKALSIKKVKFMQSPIYRNIKEFKIMKFARKIVKNNNRKDDSKNIDKIQFKCDYSKLQNYYKTIFDFIDSYHFNSYMTFKIFDKYINIKSKINRVIPISHKEIRDNRKRKKFNYPLNISYLGPAETYKGMNLLIEAIDLIYEECPKLKLNIYNDAKIDKPYVSMKGKYKYEELEGIFDKTDILVVPSIWYETFGFIALEGKSYSVPTIVTSRVGSKDIFKNGYDGFIVNPDKLDIAKQISNCYSNLNILKQINENIINSSFKFEFSYHCSDIINLYKEILDNRSTVHYEK